MPLRRRMISNNFLNPHVSPADQPKVISGHINQLDGLRAIAIMMVLWVHTGGYFLLRDESSSALLNSFVLNGRSGVDLFFVLSGFLITGILLDTKQRMYYFPRFYWRRALRIWPVYYVFLCSALILHHRSLSRIGFAPFALYYRNFLGGDFASDIYFGQFWSLCVEEQFYLVWPLIIYFCPKQLRMPLIFVLFFAALFLRTYLLSHHTDTYLIYRLTYCRMDDLVAGAALAVLIRHNVRPVFLNKLCWSATIIGGIGLYFVGRVGSPGYEIRMYTVGLTFFALLYGGVVGLCARGSGKIASALLSGSFLRAISKRSYAMYVFHLVPLYAFYKLLANMRLLPLRVPLALLVILMIGLITYGMAWLSWRYLESPFLRLKGWEWFAKTPTPVSLDRHPTE